METAAALTHRLEAAFRRIERERMAGVPILNPALTVEAVGMRPFGDDWLSVLVTPWFMNAVILPAAESGAAWAAATPGGTIRRTLPAGGFDFIVGEEEGIGRFAMCSLFSPMDDFADVATAAATAAAAIEALLAAAADDPDASAWQALHSPRATAEAPSAAAAPDDGPPPAPTRRALLGLSREARP